MMDDKMKNEGGKMSKDIMNDIVKMFEYEGEPLTAVTYKGQPAVIAKEFGKFLEYSEDGAKLPKLINSKWKKSFKDGKHFVVLKDKELKQFKELIKVSPCGGLTYAPHIMLLFKAGMYKTAFKSGKERAEPLIDFVVDEVFPQLEKYGSYDPNRIADHGLVKKGVWIPEMSSEALEVLLRERKGRELAEKERDGAIVLAREQTKRIIKVEEKMHEMQEEAAHGRAMMARKGGISIGEFADFVKVGGVRISQNKMFELLRGFGFLIDGRDKGYKRRRHNRPKAECIDRGWFEIEAKVGSDGYVRDGITLIYTLGEKEVVNMMIKYPLFKGEVIEYIERIGGRRIVRRYTGIGSGEQTTLPF
jgi:prophage antirepressor-like protein